VVRLRLLRLLLTVTELIARGRAVIADAVSRAHAAPISRQTRADAPRAASKSRAASLAGQ